MKFHALHIPSIHSRLIIVCVLWLPAFTSFAGNHSTIAADTMTTNIKTSSHTQMSGSSGLQKVNTAAEDDNACEYYYRDGKKWVKVGSGNSKLDIVVVHYMLYLFLRKDQVLYNIITNEDIRVVIEIHDMIGRQVFSAPTPLYLKKGMNEAELPVKMLAGGEYKVSVYDDRIKVVKKFFLE